MKCFYHNDLDGRCAGSIVAAFTENYNKEDYFEVDYVMSLPLDKIKDREEIWFVDYSFKENTKHIIEQLLIKRCKIIWIDHHTSSIKLESEHKYLKKIAGTRQEGISGAALTYMYCYNKEFDEIPLYIKLVSDYDCWQFNYGLQTTNFKLGIETFQNNALDEIWLDLQEEYDFFNNTGFRKNAKSLLQDIIKKGELIKVYIDLDNTYYREHFAYESEIEGYRCFVVNKKSNSWIFGEKYSEYPLVMVWVFDGNNYVYSIFSNNEDVDCSKIAEKYGGGGHKGAAGFSSKELLFKAK